MENKELKTGDVIVQRVGYNMVIYDFYLVTRLTEASIFLAKLKKISIVKGDCFHPYVLPDLLEREGEPIRKKITSYIGHKWDGQELQEDWLD